MYSVRASWMQRQALHAESISFNHIKKEEELTIHAPLPTDFAKAIDYCANHQ
jgi:23S rRNA pseudouridine1911/1915/1917 synthase